jgi:prolyl oligopeptidase
MTLMNPTATEKSLELRYPVARKIEQTDDYFGTAVSDPFRWMEDVDSAELKTWIDAENELTQEYLAKVPVRERMQKRLMELINFERYTAPERRGTRYFYSHNSGLQNQNVLYWQEGLDGEPKVLLDPNTFSEDGVVEVQRRVVEKRWERLLLCSLRRACRGCIRGRSAEDRELLSQNLLS